MSEVRPPNDAETYSWFARFLHWLTVLLVAAQVATGLTMVYRGQTLKLWDATTNTLYSTHKLIGITVLAVIVVRLGRRFLGGVPSDEPSLAAFHKIASHTAHWLLYALLIVVPVLGWLGVSMFPALDVFGLIKLPALAAPDQAQSKDVFAIHALLAFALIGLVTVHIVAALYHHFVRRDNVLRRMLPRLERRGSGGR